MDGRIVYDGQVDVVATGTVGRDGRVRARFSRRADVLAATGRIGRSGGAGTWTAPSRECAGRWEARRAGG